MSETTKLSDLIDPRGYGGYDFRKGRQKDGSNTYCKD